MVIFIVLSLAGCFLVQAASPLLKWLASPLVIYAGLAVAVVSLVAAMLEKGSARLWHDVFAGSVLLVWYAYWQPLFNGESPIFFFFPLYFVFMAAFVELFFVGQQHKMDHETLRQIRLLARQIKIKPWMIMLVVLASLALPQHYLLYPVTMTLLMLRFALMSYLEPAHKTKPPR
jgi:hypothetical protein